MAMIDYQLRQREYLLQISRAMTSELDLEEVLRLIVRNAVDMLNGQGGFIALRQSDGSYWVRVSYGLPLRLLHLFAPLLTEVPLHPEGRDLTRWTIPRLRTKLGLAATVVGLRQVVALPLVKGRDLIGVIYIFRASEVDFSANDRQVLASFANQAAIAVHNARLYQELQEEKQRLDTIIQHSADGVMILDPQCRIREFNHALEEMTGRNADRAIGHPCHEVMALKGEDGADICRDFCSLPGEDMEAGDSLYIEGDIQREDGDAITVGITYAPLLDEEGELVNVVANVHDITRFREAEEMKSTFISIISHELKTPVSLIKGYAGTLRRKDAHWDEETLKQSLAVIEEESDRLNELIDNLLEVSRLQGGGLELNKGEMRLDRLSENVVEKFRPQTNRHLLTADFPPDFPTIRADYDRMEQVLNNLISNAIKYSPQGGSVQVQGWEEGEWIYVAVSDEGIGISKQEQEHIFDRFYRAEGAMTSKTEGAGLGLYLVRAIIKAHGGKIWVESEKGHGATFIFALPRD
ncbi:MAG: ATP-binding protein [Chloroflexota bacterium]|nr:ATP-binding protein [Chloroflexota bacterium]